MRYVNNRQLLKNGLIASLLLLIQAGLANAEEHIVEMIKYKFVPEELTIKVGDTVKWVNNERRQYHTIWFKEAGEKETQEWFPGESFEKVFEKAGEYPYICGPHFEDRQMQGVIRVEP